jgi:exodeoxyribonuclease VII large subunit
VGARRLHATATANLGAARRQVGEERRALDRLQPAAQLAQSRERIGGLLDRATAAATARIADARRADERAGVRLGPLVPARIHRERERLDRAARLLPMLATARLARAGAGLSAAAAGLGALGPQATLDRGYAIVRRADDERIVRDPQEAPPGSRLHLTVAKGSLAATVIEPHESGSADG